MAKTEQTKEELESHLQDQLQFLSTSADLYDQGQIIEAKRMATTLRVLLHDTSASKSLFGQLGLKEQKIYDTASGAEKYFGLGQRIGSFAGLVTLTMGEKGVYVPVLDDAQPGMAEYATFEEYWNRIVFIDNENNKFSRRDIVLKIADQDGGAHVDPSVDENHHKLSRQDSMGWKVSGNGSEPIAPPRPDFPTIRQIAHEILRTFFPDYPRKRMETFGLPAASLTMLVVNNADAFQKVVSEWRNVGPYDLCPCKSGKKHKWCCGKK